MLSKRRALAIGADIENISRFEKLHRTKHHQFLRRVYTRNELAYCFAKRKPAQHLAARFCAKESVIKALSGLGIRGLSYSDIVIRNVAGTPEVRIAKVPAKLEISLTMSHVGMFALAAALAKKL